MEAKGIEKIPKTSEVRRKGKVKAGQDPKNSMIQ